MTKCTAEKEIAGWKRKIVWPLLCIMRIRIHHCYCILGTWQRWQQYVKRVYPVINLCRTWKSHKIARVCDIQINIIHFVTNPMSQHYSLNKMPKHSLTIFRLIISCNHIVNLVFSSGVCKVFVKTEQSRKEIENKNHAKQAQLMFAYYMYIDASAGFPWMTILTCDNTWFPLVCKYFLT